MAHYKGAASEAGRAMHLMKKREKAQQEIELRKKKIEEDLKIDNIENKFATHYDAVEQQLKSSTIGLVTLDEMKAKQEHIVREREKKLAQKKAEKEKEKQKEIEAKLAQKNKQKRQIQALSFAMCDEEEEEDSGPETSGIKKEPEETSWREKEEPTLKKIRKNPDVDTSFLPDREREEADLKLREELRLEWVMTQASLKDEPITVTFSYWDGSGHRRNVTLKKEKAERASKSELAAKMRVAKGYYRLEMAPPASMGEMAKLKQEIGIVKDFIQKKGYNNLTVKQAWLLILVSIEVGLWFFLGETIGKFHIVGYKVNPAVEVTSYGSSGAC
ncbi:protein FAM50 homolog [Leguminivora glycinivorella]|uniref:protein FAM50 homolog n=1 Tax=Leguminivora glycinivorella TaxID=1035111 RepID=UPI00200C675B|nr:protein FAM50 homolog [Leguminivora glycinivorella]